MGYGRWWIYLSLWNSEEARHTENNSFSLTFSHSHSQRLSFTFLSLTNVRSEILNSLNTILLGGALSIDAEIQVVKARAAFEPTNQIVKNALKLFEDQEYTDVSFKIGDDTYIDFRSQANTENECAYSLWILWETRQEFASNH